MKISDLVAKSVSKFEPTKQQFFSYNRLNEKNEPIEACVIGCAMYSLYKQAPTHRGDAVCRLQTMFPALNEPGARCPGCGDRLDSLLSVAYHLNDIHEWDRMKIAQFLDEKCGEAVEQ